MTWSVIVGKDKFSLTPRKDRSTLNESHGEYDQGSGVLPKMSLINSVSRERLVYEH